MSDSRPHSHLPDDIAKLGRDFESECLDGKRPQIEKWLLEVEDPQRETLFQVLLSTEIRVRMRAGDVLQAEQYRSRFPNHHKVIERAFQELDGPGPEASTPERSFESTVAHRNAQMKWTSREQFSSPVTVGKSIDNKYTLVEKLGEGGFGQVWKAWEPLLE